VHSTLRVPQSKNIIQDIAEKHSAPVEEIQAALDPRKGAKYLYFYTHLTPIVYTSIADIGVTLTIRYMCRSRERRVSAFRIQEAILIAFNHTATIDFAYPTRRTIVSENSGPVPRANPPQTRAENNAI